MELFRDHVAVRAWAPALDGRIASHIVKKSDSIELFQRCANVQTPDIPRGGVGLRKDAAIGMALGMARGALHAALGGDLDNRSRRAFYFTTENSKLFQGRR